MKSPNLLGKSGATRRADDDVRIGRAKGVILTSIAMMLAAATPAAALTVVDFAMGFGVTGDGLDVGEGGTLPPQRATENIVVPLRNFQRLTYTFSNDLFVDANGKTDRANDSFTAPKFTSTRLNLPNGQAVDVPGGASATIAGIVNPKSGLPFSKFDNHAQASKSGVVSTLTATYSFNSVVNGVDPTGQLLKATVKASVDISGGITVPNIPKTIVYGDYLGFASVTDPFLYESSDLVAAGLDSADYTWFQPFGLSSFDFALNSDRDFTVFFSDGVSERDIFTLRRDTSGIVDLLWDSETAFFLLPDIETLPDLDTASPIDMAAFRASLFADLADNMRLDTPFALGALVTNLSAGSGPGSAAGFGARSNEGEREMKTGLVPLPAPAPLLIAGLGLLVPLRWRSRAQKH